MVEKKALGWADHRAHVQAKEVETLRVEELSRGSQKTVELRTSNAECRMAES